MNILVLILTFGIFGHHAPQGPTLRGVTADGRKTVIVRLNRDSPVASLYACWDKLERKSPQCGTCYAPEGTATSGEWRRRADHPQDAACWLGVE